MRPSQVLVALAAFSSFSAAWQSPGDSLANMKGVMPMEDILFGRQDKGDPNSGSTDNSNSDSTDSTDNTDNSGNSDNTDNTDNSGDSGDSGNSDDSNSGDGGDKPSPSPTDKPDPDSTDKPDEGDSTKGDGKSTKPDPKQATKTFAPDVPPGGVSMITPAVIAGPQYYKIGDHVTFAWNYTLLRATPTKIDVLVSCQANQATYTIAGNTSVQKVIWDTNKEKSGTAPLPMAKYTLIVMDSDSAITATPEPGHLSPYNSFQFGMYIPQDYSPLPDYQCPTCNSAAPESISPKQTMTLAIITTSLTVLSFTWFARGFGVF